MKNTVRLAGLSLAGMSANLMAHPGHDHSHWSSPAMHSMLFVVLVAAGAAAVYALRQARKTRSAKQEQKD